MKYIAIFETDDAFTPPAYVILPDAGRKDVVSRAKVRPLPRRRPVLDSLRPMGDEINRGWNACLDELEGMK